MGMIIRFPRHARTSSEAGSLKPKTDGETSFPNAARASRTIIKLSCDILPLALQLLTADVPMPTSDATAPGPPKASITSSTELIIPPYSSRNVKMSSLHTSAMEIGSIAALNGIMVESLKSLASRLKITREALDLSAAELCRQINCKANRWSQYEAGERKITLEIANALCDEFGLSLDWIYRGNPALLPHALRVKMRQAA